MASLFYIWISLGVLFILIEIMTGTFYGLAVALGAFVVGILVWFFGWIDFDVLQATIFAILSGVFSYFFPRIFRSRKPTVALGMDRYIGKTYTIFRVGKDWKVKIE
jgi:membrane protein implicated in regulation of membrane protease activity